LAALLLIGSQAHAGEQVSGTSKPVAHAAGAESPLDSVNGRQPVWLRDTVATSIPFKTSARLTGTADPSLGDEPTGRPMPIGVSCSVTELPADVLARINAARVAGGSCGGEKFGKVAALAWNERLFTAALRHSADMARRNYLEHVTPEGVDAVQRMEAAGYGWSRAGENIAAGNASVESVMTAWLESEGHCRNLMSPAFAEVAVACVRDATSSYGTYWTMKLGRPERGSLSRRSPGSGPSRAPGPAPAPTAEAKLSARP
jgi:uncharacterized protein YkwD